MTLAIDERPDIGHHDVEDTGNCLSDLRLILRPTVAEDEVGLHLSTERKKIRRLFGHGNPDEMSIHGRRETLDFLSRMLDSQVINGATGNERVISPVVVVDVGEREQLRSPGRA